MQPVLLRVVPEVEVATHEAIATGHDASKFGMSLADAPGVIEAAVSMTGIRFDGIHAHVGSQVLDLEPYLRSLDRLVQTLADIRDRVGVDGRGPRPRRRVRRHATWTSARWPPTRSPPR